MVLGSTSRNLLAKDVLTSRNRLREPLKYGASKAEKKPHERRAHASEGTVVGPHRAGHGGRQDRTRRTRGDAGLLPAGAADGQRRQGGDGPLPPRRPGRRARRRRGD